MNAWSDEAISIVVDRLQESRINCLAVDFDNTLISKHTASKWKGDPSSLVKHVRPVFQALVPKAISAGIHVVVVTFSAQTVLIREVLAAAFSPDVGRHIVVRGSDGTWQYEGRGCVGGKQAHIASAYEELNMKRNSSGTQAGALVTRRSTLLIDDEMENVEAALKADTNAVLFNYKESEVSFIQSLLTLPDGR